MSSETSAGDATPNFAELGLPATLLEALNAVGYETPSPIQALSIPVLLDGRDLFGQAQTGTGKTAAFALPLLAGLDLADNRPQVLVLAPTRELAIQVSEAFRRYAAFLRGFHVLPIYGGQDYRGQLAQLKRGAHVVVGTPGRVMDHMRRGTLNLDGLRSLVLDEADEMLRMGFIDDVSWILEQTPPQRQIALFSATLPKVIREIADKHLREPEHISIEVKTATAETIRQRYWYVSGLHKLDALTRMLEVEDFDGVIVFVRTRTATVELTEKLEARGYSAAAMNGDIPQKLREQTVQRFKSGKLDILVATDVAARGLDVERVSHVINYDIPHDTEAYIHRIGRTGRAGRTGEAILFVAPREKRMLSLIERATRQKITEMQLPTTEAVNDKRIAGFHQQITDTIMAGELEFFRELVDTYRNEHNVPADEIAAALAKLAQQGRPLLLKAAAEPARDRHRHREEESGETTDARTRGRKRPHDDGPPLAGMERYRVEVGHAHGVKPGNIMGAIANEAGLEGRYIGRIQILDDHSLVDLPEGMPDDIFNDLKKARVAGQALRISRASGETDARRPRQSPPAGHAEKRQRKTPPAPAVEKPSAKGKPSPRAGGKPAKGKNQRPGKNARQAAKKGEAPQRPRKTGTLTTAKRKD